ncbi:ferrochelatase [Chelatococcus sp.]|uniref:ferrochelatase n=1 Tax=Chelatococcus sp. TaxID=1953771 RepID=UPI0025B8FD73|nr:ferrochelatase [Chelatococcus sp.]
MDKPVATASPRPLDHPAINPRRIGVLIANLGTPEATDYWSMRRYLKEFLSDRRVIETPRLLWWFILNGIVLTTRPGRKGKDYETIWNKALNESPLKTITRSQATKLQATLSQLDDRIVVEWGMRYGHPSMKAALTSLQEQGCDRILLVPLYPQYAAATTATACDKAFEALMQMRWQPSLRVAPPYYDDPVYIEAAVAGLRQSIAALDFEPEVILASFHGIPKEYMMKGDPYHCQCVKTWRLMREAMGLSADAFMMSFQSRFGRAEWLQPYTDATVQALAERGVKRLAVVMPGFSVDCLETLEEIAGENGEIFHHHGGEKFAAIPCLNDSPEGMQVISHVAIRELQGWIGPSAG